MGVGGVLTLSMLLAFVAPRAGLTAMFGEAIEGPLGAIVVRSWASMIALGGAMLIWGAFHPQIRPFVLFFTAVGKAIFVLLVLLQGRRYLRRAGVACALDLTMAALFAWYLVATGA
jgi:hypothetical protein